MEKQVGLYKIIIILKCGVSRGSGATFKLLYKQNIMLDFQKRLFFWVDSLYFVANGEIFSKQL